MRKDIMEFKNILCTLVFCTLLAPFPVVEAARTYTRKDVCREIMIPSEDTIIIVDFNYKPSAEEYNTTYQCRTTFRTNLFASNIALFFLEPTQLSKTGTCDNELDIVLSNSGAKDKRCVSLSPQKEIVTSRNVELNFISSGLNEAYFKVVLYTVRKGLCTRGDIMCIKSRCINKNVVCELENDTCGHGNYKCPNSTSFYAIITIVIQFFLTFCIIIFCMCRNRTKSHQSTNTSNQNNENDQNAAINPDYFLPPPAYETLTQADSHGRVAESSSNVKFTSESREMWSSEPPPPYDKLFNDYMQRTRL